LLLRIGRARGACRGVIPALGFVALVGFLAHRLVVIARLLGEQGLPVGDRDPVIVGMNLAERQETVPVAAVLNEGRLQGGFDPRDLGEVDVSLELRPCSRFVIKFFETCSVQHHHPRLLRVGGIDKHTLDH
jgi:hypothetical protein